MDLSTKLKITVVLMAALMAVMGPAGPSQESAIKTGYPCRTRLALVVDADDRAFGQLARTCRVGHLASPYCSMSLATL